MLESLDNGKPIRESRDIDMPLVARHFYHHAGWAQLMERELPGRDAGGRRRPDHPVELPAADAGVEDRARAGDGKHGGAQARRVHLAHRAAASPSCASEVGLPAGRREHHHRRRPDRRGAGRPSRTWTRSPSPARPRSAALIRTATAGSGKKLSLELGGKSPFIVFQDADLDSVVEGVVDAIWFNQGQVCCAGSRILAQEGVAERLVAKLKARMETLRVGDPLDKAVDIGAIVAPVQLERIEELVRRGQEEGATLWQPSWSCPREGWFFPPTLFTDVAPAATIAQVEIFGPVVVLMTFRTPAEAVELAEQHPLRPRGERLDREHQPRARRRARSSRRARSGSTAPTCSTRPAGSAGIARAGSGGKAGGRGSGST